MSLPYKYTVDDAVMQVFATSPKRHRDELLRIFNRLAEDPFTRGDWIQKDNTGRECQVKRFGPWSVTFWPEHFSSQVHVIDIERLI